MYPSGSSQQEFLNAIDGGWTNEAKYLNRHGNYKPTEQKKPIVFGAFFCTD